MTWRATSPWPYNLDPAVTKSDTLQLFLPKKSLPPGTALHSSTYQLNLSHF
jgi:hypothetical protein